MLPNNVNQIILSESKEYKDFINEICNWDTLESIFLSFDVDWAPDYMLDDLINLLGDAPATFFITHNSKCVRKIEDNYSVGTHPNLSKGSSQGDGIDQCIEFFKKKKLSKFTLNRFHILGFSYRDLVALSKEGLELDSSSLFLNHHYLTPHFQNELNIVNAPYFWEDGMRLNNKVSYNDSFINYNCPGLKIFDFHPIDIYLNTYSIEHRNEFKFSFDSVINAKKGDAEKFINKSHRGTRDILIELLEKRKRNEFKIYDLGFLNNRFRDILKYE